jgi:phospholipid/cholesterol/gamma-HCH transport system substrate-binding protein
MPRFREKSTLAVAVVGVVATVGAVAGSFALADLPLIAGTTYRAEFSEGGGMQPGSEVWVAGTAVGTVSDMELAGDKVLVTFTAKDVELGDRTSAAIRTGSLLGKRYLGLEPRGDEPMGSGDTIPLARTSAPYNLSETLENVTRQVGEIDQLQLQEALNTFSDAFADTPPTVQATLQNVKRLSDTIASRDAALRELLQHANSVSGTLNDRVGQIRQLVQDSNLLLAELQSRREVIDRTIDTLNGLAADISALVDENYDELLPELDAVNGLLEVLKKHNADLTLSFDRVASFIGGLGEGIAGSPAFSAMLQLGTGLVSANDYLPQLAGAPGPAPALPLPTDPQAAVGSLLLPQGGTPVSDPGVSPLAGLPLVGGGR